MNEMKKRCERDEAGRDRFEHVVLFVVMHYVFDVD
jgi:hypothetical protein